MLDTEKIADRYVAEIPYLLGYNPTNSVVAVWLHADYTMSFAQRVDIDETMKDLKHFVEVGDSNPRSASLVLIYSDTPMSELWDTAIEIGDAIEDHDITVVDIIRVNGLEYRTFFMPKDELDSQPAVQIDEVIHAQVSEYHGNSSLLDSRDDLILGYESKPEISPEYAQLMLDILSDEELDVSDAFSEFVDAFYNDFIDEKTLVRLSCYVHDIQLRDDLLIEITKFDKDEFEYALSFAAKIIQVTPHTLSAPIYTIASIIAWNIGNGALANVLIDRAREVNPNYSLAELISMSLAVGMSPQLWREMIESL